MKLETSEEGIDDTAYEIAEAAWKDFGATEEARYPRARLEAAIRKALAERAPPPPHVTIPEDALLEMLRTGSSMVYVNHVPGEVWRAPPAPPLPAEVEEMRKAIEAYLAETANPGETLYDGHPKVLLNRAASLLSRWPGVSPLPEPPHE